MAEHLATASSDLHRVVDLDLRDETGLLAAETAEYDIDGVRALLAAINLQPVGRSETEEDREAEVMDLAVFRATGSLSLARIFGPSH
jgi:hypothetical protein